MNITVYTDGSCQRNKFIIAGYGVHFPNKEFPDISNRFLLSPITNQRAELYAIYKALLVIHESKKQINSINLYTDSMYSINCFTVWINTWLKNNMISSNNKPVKNQDIIIPTYKLIQKFNITFHHVRSHTNKTDCHSIGNSVADKLACAGSLKAKEYYSNKYSNSTNSQ